ncbi:DUF4384 domain-containing protein [Marivita hallyeonensis]|uniref:DUF4384 domain-containing protein n=1 Tax=Marivita hallyeonensis TaxID=996342 RepID=UPI00116055D6|nr:DUF4384 domain-containing protein [Marivita hallyeonensis]
MKRSEAEAATPDADTLAANDVDGTRLGQAAVATTSAPSIAPTVEALSALRDEATSVTLLTSTTDALQDIAHAEPASIVDAPITSTETGSLPTDAITPQSIVPKTAEALSARTATSAIQEPMVSVATTAPVMGAQIAVMRPSSQGVMPSRPLVQLAPPQQKPILAAVPVEPTSVSARAALAFDAPGDGPIDPVSLTAFQSFMAPDSLGAQTTDVRDGIANALADIPCSRLQVRFDPDANTLIVGGHVPEPALRQSVVTAMQSKMGADIPVRESLRILPSPQCNALTGIDRVGLAQSTDQITNPLLVGPDLHAREFNYVEGQALVLDLQGADYDAFIYVDFFDAGGNVLHLAPNEFVPLEVTAAKTSIRIGSENKLLPGEPGLHIRIGPPFGQEIAVAFATSVPLHDGVRPLIEPADQYLAWLRDRVTTLRDRHPDFKGEWVYFFVSTSAN